MRAKRASKFLGYFALPSGNGRGHSVRQSTVTLSDIVGMITFGFRVEDNPILWQSYSNPGGWNDYMLNAEIIAIGLRDVDAFRIDTNSLWLTERLNAIGVEVRLKTIVGDDEGRLEEAIRDALRRSQIVISTGGLARPRMTSRERSLRGY
jgi:hypothetical protein